MTIGRIVTPIANIVSGTSEQAGSANRRDGSRVFATAQYARLVLGGTVDTQTAQYQLPANVRGARIAAQAFVAIAAVGLTAWSAVLVKENNVRTPLVSSTERASAQTETLDAAEPAQPINEIQAQQFFDEFANAEPVADGTIRWFDGRRVRPVRTIWMRVTAYSPDARSCGKWADGQTATMHSVWTNAMRLVAADTKVLPFRSIISVPGYADSEIVPVLDRGGAIKGNRLDVLFPTHQIALKWGVRDLPITVWEYDDED